MNFPELKKLFIYKSGEAFYCCSQKDLNGPFRPRKRIYVKEGRFFACQHLGEAFTPEICRARRKAVPYCGNDYGFCKDECEQKKDVDKNFPIKFKLRRR